MDPAQMANEAVKRLIAIRSTTTSGTTEVRDPREVDNEPVLHLFEQLGALDGWAKLAEARLAANPQDARAAKELCSCLDHTARLHTQFIRRLDDVVHDRPDVTMVSVPQQSSSPVASPR